MFGELPSRASGAVGLSANETRCAGRSSKRVVTVARGQLLLLLCGRKGN